jgi:hypothetical protein
MVLRLFLKRLPLVQWSRLNPLDLDQVGDSKIICELNHQWLVRIRPSLRPDRLSENESSVNLCDVRSQMPAIVFLVTTASSV